MKLGDLTRGPLVGFTVVTMARKITHIVIHTSATATTANRHLRSRPIDASAEGMRQYHINKKGWKDIGYHHVIRMDGLHEGGRSEENKGAGVLGFNKKSIHICFSGHGNIAPFTDDQIDTGYPLIYNILLTYDLVGTFLKNPMRVLGHRECNIFWFVPRIFKSCPGKLVDMRKFRLGLIAYVKGQDVEKDEPLVDPWSDYKD